jgi:hypothetical protein
MTTFLIRVIRTVRVKDSEVSTEERFFVVSSISNMDFANGAVDSVGYRRYRMQLIFVWHMQDILHYAKLLHTGAF